jgi:hypothetical protein
VISSYNQVLVALVVVLDEINTRHTVAAGEPTGRKRIFWMYEPFAPAVKALYKVPEPSWAVLAVGPTTRPVLLAATESVAPTME